MANFKAVEACVNVDTVCAEDSQEEHINVVQEVEVDEVAPDQTAENFRHDNASQTLVGRHNWDRGYSWNDELVSPSEVNHVIDKA